MALRLVDPLILPSEEEYEDDDDENASHSREEYRLVDWLKWQLLQSIDKEEGLFNAVTHVDWLQRSIFPMIESYHLTMSSALSLYHIFLT